MKTSLKQKTSLIIFGIFLAVILLEAGLRIAGAVVLYLQERHNHFSFTQNEYRILCLGESTTALGGEDSFPSQLEAMLNAQSRQKEFTVINKGVISTTTEDILAHIEQNLDRTKPQLVVVMMGINDKAYLHAPYKALWWENIKLYLKDLRVYKLADLLYEHISHRIKEINAPANTADLPHPDEGNYQQVENFLKLVITESIQRYHGHMSASAQYQQNRQMDQARQEEQFARQSVIQASLACIELAKRYRIQGFFQEAVDILQQATALNPNSTDIYQEWGELYLAQEKYPQAVKYFQEALALDPKNTDALLELARAYYQEHNDNAFLVYTGYLQMKPQNYWGHIELAKWLRENKHYDLAQGYLSHAMEFAPEFDQAYVDMGQILDDQGQFKQEEAFYLKEIALHPKSSPLYQAIGQFYQKQGKEDRSKEYFRKAAQKEVAEYYPVTFVNYALLLNKILSRNIKVVVMQYPLRDIGPLKDYLGQRKGVIFVENKQNFKQALIGQGFNHLFKDNFAYDFGHCTREGNELIARNLKDAILNKILISGQ